MDRYNKNLGLRIVCEGREVPFSVYRGNIYLSDYLLNKAKRVHQKVKEYGKDK